MLYRREGETAWKTLRKATSDTDPRLGHDDGAERHLLREDRRVGRAVESARAPRWPASSTASAFEIDNTPPAIAVGTVRVERGRTIIPFDVKDDHSPVQRVEFSQDGQRWRGVFPVDGIADSREEHYELVVDGELGDRGLTLRASDSMNNVETIHVDAPRSRRTSELRTELRTSLSAWNRV